MAEGSDDPSAAVKAWFDDVWGPDSGVDLSTTVLGHQMDEEVHGAYKIFMKAFFDGKLNGEIISGLPARPSGGLCTAKDLKNVVWLSSDIMREKLEEAQLLKEPLNNRAANANGKLVKNLRDLCIKSFVDLLNAAWEAMPGPNPRSRKLPSVLPKDLPCSSAVEVYTILDTDPREGLRGQEAVRVRDDLGKKLPKGTCIGTYRGKMQFFKTYTSALHKNGGSGSQWLKAKLMKECYTADIGSFNPCEVARLIPSLAFNGMTPRNKENNKLIVSAYGMGNLTCVVNDPHVDPFDDLNDSVVQPPNTALMEIMVGGWPFLAMFTLRDLNAGDELLYDYGRLYWSLALEHLNTIKAVDADGGASGSGQGAAAAAAAAAGADMSGVADFAAPGQSIVPEEAGSGDVEAPRLPVNAQQEPSSSGDMQEQEDPAPNSVPATVLQQVSGSAAASTPAPMGPSSHDNSQQSVGGGGGGEEEEEEMQCQDGPPSPPHESDFETPPRVGQRVSARLENAAAAVAAATDAPVAATAQHLDLSALTAQINALEMKLQHCTRQVAAAKDAVPHGQRGRWVEIALWNYWEENVHGKEEFFGPFTLIQLKDKIEKEEMVGAQYVFTDVDLEGAMDALERRSIPQQLPQGMKVIDLIEAGGRFLDRIEALKELEEVTKLLGEAKMEMQQQQALRAQVAGHENGAPPPPSKQQQPPHQPPPPPQQRQQLAPEQDSAAARRKRRREGKKPMHQPEPEPEPEPESEPESEPEQAEEDGDGDVGNHKKLQKTHSTPGTIDRCQLKGAAALKSPSKWMEVKLFVKEEAKEEEEKEDIGQEEEASVGALGATSQEEPASGGGAGCTGRRRRLFPGPPEDEDGVIDLTLSDTDD